MFWLILAKFVVWRTLAAWIESMILEHSLRAYEREKHFAAAAQLKGVSFYWGYPRSAYLALKVNKSIDWSAANAFLRHLQHKAITCITLAPFLACLFQTHGMGTIPMGIHSTNIHCLLRVFTQNGERFAFGSVIALHQISSKTEMLVVEKANCFIAFKLWSPFKVANFSMAQIFLDFVIFPIWFWLLINK